MWPELYSPGRRRADLRRRLSRWYAHAGRDLPWRRTADPYAVLVSEVMLQQTQVQRVLPAYVQFLDRFPTLATLARASLGDVLRAWGGLGYPRRARDLHRAARTCPAALPGTRAELDALPGVGRYTAGAVACFAHGHDEAFADVNIARVLGRVERGGAITLREAEVLDASLLPPGDSARWHHALMDLGATVCTSRAPRCDVCPFDGLCRARAIGVVPTASRHQAAFATSDRRVRGRILAALRAATDGLTPAALRAHVDDERVGRLIVTLVEEGLVERSGRRIILPA